MKINEFVSLYKPEIKRELSDYLDTRLKNAPPDLPYFTEAANIFSGFVPEGKLFRGLLVIIGRLLSGQSVSPDALKLAAAVEIVHSTLLIHDDIMDDDKLRRGKKALFAHYESKGLNNKIVEPKHYGQSMAICIGDIGFFLAFEILAGMEPKNLSTILGPLSRELQYVGAMQMGDVDFGMGNFEPTAEEIISVYRYKTGRYTISVPLTLGAKLGNAPESLVKKLDAYGEELGILFQMRDDELSLFGDEAVTGKPVGSDIRENKKTLLRHLIFQHANNEELAQLKQIFGKNNINTGDMETFRGIYNNSKGQKIFKEKIKSTLEKLHKDIESLNIGNDTKELLHTFTDYIVLREK